MSRITGTDALSLVEAYNAVYAPQELTEEQVWEEVEYWVNSLLEEGYDLSDYTWDDMYNLYEDEIGRAANWLGGQARRFGARALRGAADVGGAALQGIVGTPTTSKNPLAQAANAVTRYNPSTAIPRAEIRFGQGLLGVNPYGSGGGGGGSRPSTAPYQSRFAGSRDAAIHRARQIQGSPIVGPRPAAAPAPGGSRPPAPAPGGSRPSPRPAAPAAPAPRPTAPASAKPTPAAAPERAGFGVSARALPLAGLGGGAPTAPSAQKSEISAMIDRSKARQAASTPTPSRPSGPTIPGREANIQRNIAAAKPTIKSSFDPFDVIKGHLLDEGYADTEEAALTIMANMSEEWIESIVEETLCEKKGERRKTKRSSYWSCR